MKCQFIRADIEVQLKMVAIDFHDQVEMREVLRNDEMKIVPFWKAGAIYDHPDAFLLVQHGVAVPADEECAKKARRTPEQMAASQRAYSRTAAGIHPDDNEKWELGQIVGYNPDGSFKPGPNFAQLQAQEESDDEDEDQ